jgi:tetratricopeptide (TPR) repeat protein/ADP-heptose:LPS heptosyltransferase
MDKPPKEDALRAFKQGNNAMERGAWAEAVPHFLHACSLDPGRPSIRLALAAAYLRQNNSPEARRGLEVVLSGNPFEPDAWVLLGVVNDMNTCGFEALACFERAIALDPNNIQAKINKGALLKRLGHFQLGLDLAEEVLRIDPNSFEALTLKGTALMSLGDNLASLHCFESALQLAPENPTALVNASSALNHLGDNEKALDLLKRALAQNPHHKVGRFNLAETYRDLGQLETALREVRQLHAAEPENADTAFLRSTLELSHGDHALGWELYKARFYISKKPSRALFDTRSMWRGEATNALIIWCEQGIGEQILFSSLIAEVAKRVADVQLLVSPKLETLLKRSHPNITVVSDQAHLNEKAQQIAMGSLGELVRTSKSDFPEPRPTLVANPKLITEMQQHLQHPTKLVIGLSWHSSNSLYGSAKSLDVSDLAPLLKCQDLRLVNLQYGDVAKDLTPAIGSAHASEVINPPGLDCFNDIEGLAAAIKACDVVVTASNTNAHIAAALGVPVLLLLSSGRGSYWYWEALDRGIPWYPGVEICRQIKGGDWRPAITSALGRLKHRQTIKLSARQ